MIRILLLLLMTIFCFGIQKLLDRQRHAEQEAREFALKQQQLQAAGRLAAEIAHQLKNPLAIINNAAWSLQRLLPDSRQAPKELEIIREEVQKSDRIITELMGYARLAEGKVERIDIRDELERAIETVFPPGSNFSIQVHRDFALGLPGLAVQRGHLEEVFVNLLTNAREAMEGRGEIWISAKPGPDLSVEICIRDDGPGISSEIGDRVFEPYFTTKSKGTGLGLAIVRHNTELYGGSVRVDSQPGKGTTFTIILPARTVFRFRS